MARHKAKLFQEMGVPSLVVAIWLISSCYAPPKAKGGFTAARRESASPRLPEEGTPLPEYLLGFGDVIEVKVFDNERFNETVVVRPDGRITLEKIGDILAAGMTPSEVDSLVTATYSKFIRNPDVTVFVRQFGGYQVYVYGEVNTPGAFPLQREMNVLQVLASAGGPKDTAKLRNVMILRRGRADELEAVMVDVSAVVKNGGAPEALHVRAQDVVYVPKTPIASASAFLQQVYDGVLPPLDIYLRAALWWTR